MWQKPWGYREGFTISAGLFLTGMILQITLGKTELELLSWPVNLIAGIVYILSLAGIYLSGRKSHIVNWLCGYQAAITAMIAVVILTVVMGLTRQVNANIEVRGIESWTGFSQMLSSWPFTLLLMWFITVLGMTILRRLSHFRWRDLPFHLNHIGLFLALTGAILGNADMKRLKMTTTAGKAEWRAFDEQNRIVELPLAIELHDFTIDEYPPKLMLIDNESGQALPAGKPENLLIEDEFKAGKLGGWEISVTQQLPMAASVATTDTLKFVEFHSIGATTALYVKVRNIDTQQETEGWVSCGSFMFPYKALRLDETVSLIMPEREPRRFVSDITVYTRSGERQTGIIEVNEPMKIDGWKIYQLSYDETKGRWSETSIFELVSDPWLPIVYTGIWMMIAGAICMFTIAQQRKEDKA